MWKTKRTNNFNTQRYTHTQFRHEKKKNRRRKSNIMRIRTDVKLTLHFHFIFIWSTWSFFFLGSSSCFNTHSNMGNEKVKACRVQRKFATFFPHWAFLFVLCFVFYFFFWCDSWEWLQYMNDIINSLQEWLNTFKMHIGENVIRV